MQKSDSIVELTKALVKAQSSYNALIKDSKNPFFKSKYADLAACIECTREPLARNGLAVMQSTEVDGDKTVVETILAHISGEWIAGRYPLTPIKNDCQGLGAALTYARRYSLTAMLGIAAEDDDGETASGRGGTRVEDKPAAVWSNALIDEVKKLSRDGKVGRDVLKDYIQRYNLSTGTKYENITDLNSDEKLRGLISFIEKTPPSKI